jgi:hypothetical protein
MTDAPERMWRETIKPCAEYKNGGSFYHESPTPRKTVEYIRADLVPGWQTIETAPKDGSNLDLWCRREHCHGHVDYVRICNASWGDMVDFVGNIYQGWQGIQSPYHTLIPTHWMPLPTPPKGGE